MDGQIHAKSNDIDPIELNRKRGMATATHRSSTAKLLTKGSKAYFDAISERG